MKKSETNAANLLADDDAWERAGRELRLRDPQRYLAILKIAEDICSIYRNPLGDVCGGDAVYVFPAKKSGQFD